MGGVGVCALSPPFEVAYLQKLLLRSMHPETLIYHWIVGSGIVFNHQNLKIIIIASDAAIKTSGQRHNER